MTLNEFKKMKETNKIGHIGLKESVYMIADRLGWEISKLHNTMDPIITNNKIKTETVTVEPNKVIGIQQVFKGYVKDEEKIELIFRASIGEKEPQDKIEIYGVPDITSVIEGGVNGDIGTCAIVLNSIKRVIEATPGLLTMADLPMVSYWSE